MTLAETAQQFPIDGYLVVGNPRRSSWINGTERALAFFWEPPTGGAKLVRTQAPYIIRQIQRFFGADNDGIFGEQTRQAIENHARANGLNPPRGWSAWPQLLGYALSTAVLGGGSVIFPSRNDFPNTNRPSLAPSPRGRESSYVGILDLLTRQESPLGVTTPQPVPHGAMPAPSPPGTPVQPPVAPPPGTPVQPPVAPPPGTPAPQPQLSITPIGPDGKPPATPLPADLSAFIAMLPASADGYVTIDGTVFQVPPQYRGGDGAPLDLTAMVQLSPFAAVVKPLPCDDKAFFEEGGVCKLKGYGKIPGAKMAIPNPHGIVVDFADPATYRNANQTAAVATVGTLTAGAALLGALVRR